MAGQGSHGMAGPPLRKSYGTRRRAEVRRVLRSRLLRLRRVHLFGVFYPPSGDDRSADRPRSHPAPGSDLNRQHLWWPPLICLSRAARSRSRRQPVVRLKAPHSIYPRHSAICDRVPGRQIVTARPSVVARVLSSRWPSPTTLPPRAVTPEKFSLEVDPDSQGLRLAEAY